MKYPCRHSLAILLLLGGAAVRAQTPGAAAGDPVEEQRSPGPSHVDIKLEKDQLLEFRQSLGRAESKARMMGILQEFLKKPGDAAARFGDLQRELQRFQAANPGGVRPDNPVFQRVLDML